ncbi:hypothetical protein AB0N06_16480 [Streptomyces sp. NPDC051020]|uniref:hypothetical protein n=1 Tax=Streptomyces sp. NPDC051020 TaxID=3155409 RepID=UPI00342D0D2F
MRAASALSPMLQRLAAERATGALMRDRGTLYLADGQVVHAESPSTPGLDILLTASGALHRDGWWDAVARGGFRELLVRGETGYIATYAAGSSAVLTLLAEDRINVGRLHLEGRRAGTRIGELVDTALKRTAQPAPPPYAPRPRTHPPAPSRTARSTRNARKRSWSPRPARKGNEHSWPTPKRHSRKQ